MMTAHKTTLWSVRRFRHFCPLWAMKIFSLSLMAQHVTSEFITNSEQTSWKLQAASL